MSKTVVSHIDPKTKADIRLKTLSRSGEIHLLSRAEVYKLVAALPKLKINPYTRENGSPARGKLKDMGDFYHAGLDHRDLRAYYIITGNQIVITEVGLHLH
jgi:hypothetical protein